MSACVHAKVTFFCFGGLANCSNSHCRAFTPWGSQDLIPPPQLYSTEVDRTGPRGAPLSCSPFWLLHGRWARVFKPTCGIRPSPTWGPQYCYSFTEVIWRGTWGEPNISKLGPTCNPIPGPLEGPWKLSHVQGSTHLGLSPPDLSPLAGMRRQSLKAGVWPWGRWASQARGLIIEVLLHSRYVLMRWHGSANRMHFEIL